MKIAILTPFFFPHIGGMERSLYNLSKGLHKEGHDVIVFTTNYGGSDENQSFRIIRDKQNGLSDWAKNLTGFLQAYGPFDAAIYGGIGRDVVGGIIDSLEECKHRGTKSFLRVPTSDHIMRHLREMNANEILAKINHFVCIDKLAVNELNENYRLNNVHYIPNGVDTELYVPISPFLDRSRTILYSGRIAKRKNVGVIVSLARLFNDQYNFIIQGSPSYGELEYYDEIINSFKTLENVRLIDPAWDNHEVYQQAGIFILPSDVEGCANSLLEAMSCEVYCFASNIVENETIISTFGTCFDLGSKALEESLAGFQKTLENNTLLARKGRAHIVENFSISKTVNKWLEILNA